MAGRIGNVVGLKADAMEHDEETAPGSKEVHKVGSLLHLPEQLQLGGTLQRWCFQKENERTFVVVLLSTCAFIMLLKQLSTWGLLLASSAIAASPAIEPSQISAGPTGRICTVKVAPNGQDSASNILSAFESCGQSAEGVRNVIRFQNTTYTIASVLDTTGLKNVDIQLQGTLSWNNNDINYWLENSLPMGYQNQSTAWLLGGDGIKFEGHGAGTFNGNGDAWYQFVNGASNYPRRPHQLTITNTTNSVFEGLIFLQSQMWTMTVIHSSNVLLQDIYVNNTSKTGVSWLLIS